MLKQEQLGVATERSKGSAIFTIQVSDASHLASLSAKPLSAISHGVYAGYMLMPRAGTVKVIEVGGKRVDTLRCCGALNLPGAKHKKPTECAAYTEQRAAAAGTAIRLKPRREIAKRAAARPAAFLEGAQRTLARARGLESSLPGIPREQ